MAGIIDKVEEASKGGFQSIKRIEGVLLEPQRVAANPNFKVPEGGKVKDQLQLTLEDALILQMDEGETAPELKDDKFTWWLKYAEPGKDKPHQNSLVVQGFIKSARELWAKRGDKDKTWRDLVGSRVVLERQFVICFYADKEKKDPKGFETYVFVEGGDSGAGVEDYIKKGVIGQSEKMAKRFLTMDDRAKRFTEYKLALENGTLTEKLGIALKDGIFVEK